MSLEALADQAAIRTNLAQHSRAVDRADAAMLAQCYHRDGTVDYGFFKGAAVDFAPILAGAQAQGPVTQHRTAQMWIELGDDVATSESYVMAYAGDESVADSPVQRLICGRYLDRHEKRAGQWRLAHRAYVLDTNLNWSGRFSKPGLGPLDGHVPVGGHGSADAGMAILATEAARQRTRTNGESGMQEAVTDTGGRMVETLVARQQIADLTMAYCRGVDRADRELLASIFHADATVVSGAFNGPAREFAETICAMVEDVYEQTFHSIANQWIEISGESAVGETYVIAVSTTRGGGQAGSDTLTGGRYIDSFERREGVWKIASRSFVLDWMRSEPITRQMDEGLYAALDLRGCRGAGDPVYALAGTAMAAG